jgi:hypothetical protein
MSALRDIATLRFSEPVSGRVTRKHHGRRELATALRVVRVHPLVMAAARAAQRPGERIEIVSSSTVRLVH